MGWNRTTDLQPDLDIVGWIYNAHQKEIFVIEELLGRLRAEAQRENFSDDKLRQLAKILSYV